MKRKLIPFCIFLVTFFTTHAQEPKTDDYKGEEYGAGAKQTTSVSTDEKLNKIITVEIKEAGGLTRRKIVWRKDVEGKWSKEDTCFKPSGKAEMTDNFYFDKDFKFVRRERYFFDKTGSGKQGGEDLRIANPPKIDAELYEMWENNGKEYIDKIEKDFNAADDPGIAPCRKAQSCVPKTELLGGYSYLNAGSDPDNESLALGAHLAFTYMVTRQLGLVADASIHSKKENEFRITRAFLMGGLQYHLMKEREKRLLVYLRLLAGLALDRQKYSSGETNNINKANAFAMVAGLGLSFPINRIMLLSLIPDYIFTNFNEETQGNIRVSLGLKFNLGCR